LPLREVHAPSAGVEHESFRPRWRRLAPLITAPVDGGLYLLVLGIGDERGVRVARDNLPTERDVPGVRRIAEHPQHRRLDPRLAVGRGPAPLIEPVGDLRRAMSLQCPLPYLPGLRLGGRIWHQNAALDPVAVRRVAVMVALPGASGER